jgi:hypothetical protein
LLAIITSHRMLRYRKHIGAVTPSWILSQRSDGLRRATTRNFHPSTSLAIDLLRDDKRCRRMNKAPSRRGPQGKRTDDRGPEIQSQRYGHLNLTLCWMGCGSARHEARHEAATLLRQRRGVGDECLRCECCLPRCHPSCLGRVHQIARNCTVINPICSRESEEI